MLAIYEALTDFEVTRNCSGKYLTNDKGELVTRLPHSETDRQCLSATMETRKQP